MISNIIKIPVLIILVNMTISSLAQSINIVEHAGEEIHVSKYEVDSIFFGIRLGSSMSDKDVIEALNKNCNLEVRVLTDGFSKAYKLKKIRHEGFYWDNVLVQTDVLNNIISTVRFNKFIPHDFNFAQSLNDSVNIVAKKIMETLKTKYGEPSRNFGATVWRGMNSINVICGISAVNQYTRTNIPESMLEGYSGDGFIISLQYLYQKE